MLKLGGVAINIMPFVMTGINLASASVYGKKITFKEKGQLYGMALLFLVLLYNSPSALLFYWTCNNLLSLVKNTVYAVLYPNGELTAEVVSKKKRTALPQEGEKQLFILALLCTSILVFVALPMTVLSSGIAGEFEENLSYYLSHMIMCGFVFSITMGTIYNFVAPRWKKVLLCIISLVSIYAVINAFIFPANYGDMSQFFFNDKIVVSWISIVSNALLLTSVSVALSYLFLKKKTKLLVSFFSICLISLTFLVVKESYTFMDKRKGYNAATASRLDKAFTFSKNKKNVVVLMLDRFIGGYVPQILKFLPEIKDEFDGFTWYSESLSTGSCTISGVPSIMGGWDYHPREIHTTRKDVPLMEKLNESTRIMPYNFSKAGFDVSIYSGLSRWLKKSDKRYLENVKHEDLSSKYHALWLKDRNKKLGIDRTREKLAMFGLFRVAPPFLRKKIYDKGKWNLIRAEKPVAIKNRNKFVSFSENSSYRIKTTIKNWSILDYLPELSKSSDSVKGQFYYMSSDLTHEPYIIDSNFNINMSGRIDYPRSMYNKFGRSLYSLKHLYTDAAALKLLSEWFKWMKAAGVYDNTRIILVSDHGSNIYNPMFKGKQIPGSRGKLPAAAFHNMVMFKDFKSHGQLEESKSFMVTCDVPSLAMEGVVEGVNPYTGNSIKKVEEKFPFYFYDTQWRNDKQKKYEYRVKESFKVDKGTIFNLKNWRTVDEK